jgi:hypothetical protein
MGRGLGPTRASSSESGEECGGAYGESVAAVFGGCCRGRVGEFAGAFDVAFCVAWDAHLSAHRPSTRHPISRGRGVP